MSDLIDLRGGQRFSSLANPRPVGQSIKRAIDIVLALGAILLVAPLLLFCCLSLVLFSPGPILFRHKRAGFQGKTFSCLKFRTMVIGAEQRLNDYLEAHPDAKAEWLETRKLRYDPRVTALGTIFRKTSLDELPQLFNVLKGDMSIVGPRPITQEEFPRYTVNLPAYMACRPGITGLWQVSGRSNTSYEMRVAYDTYYSRNWSMLLDAKIMLVTIPALLNSDNAY